MVVHQPDFFDTLLISLFKLFEALLKFDELIRKPLVVLGVVRVKFFGLSLLHPEESPFLSQSRVVLLQLLAESLLLLQVHLLTLVKHIVIEAELLLVELVYSLHVLHAFLEDLHLGLQLNLLLSLFVGILTHDFLQLLRVLLFLFLALLQKAGFDNLVLVEELLDLLSVAVKNVHSLSVEFRLNRLQLLVVVLTHLAELRLHALNE